MKPSKTLLSLALLLASAGLASQASAVPLDTTSTEFLGSIAPGVPSGADAELAYLNRLLDLAPGASDPAFDAPGGPVAPQDIDRSLNPCSGGVCEDAVAAGAVKDDTDPSNSIDVTGFTYLYAKYGGGQNEGISLVWDVSDIDGVVEIPAAFGDCGGNGCGLSHWVLYNLDGGGGSTQVPEPAIPLLLGAGLAAVAVYARRRAGKKLGERGAA